jgi:hypothetical protein
LAAALDAAVTLEKWAGGSKGHLWPGIQRNSGPEGAHLFSDGDLPNLPDRVCERLRRVATTIDLEKLNCGR